MLAIDQALTFLDREPSHPSAPTLRRLLDALTSGTDFPVADLYDLDFDRFNLALDVLQDWRLYRYGKGNTRYSDTPASAL